MDRKISDFVENYGNAFIVGDLISGNQIYINKSANKLFGITIDDCDFTKIFDRSELRLNEVIEQSLESNKTCVIYNIPANKANGEKIIVDVQLGFFNKEKTEVFLEVIPYNQKNELMALNQIDNSVRAEAILQFDEKLTMYHCNEKFCAMLGLKSIQEIDRYKFDNQPLSSIKDEIIDEVYKKMQTTDYYKRETQVITNNGDKKWVCMEFQKRKFSDFSEKIMCFVTNIEKNKQTEQKLSSFSKYFTAMQSLSNESLYTVDVKTRVLRQEGVVAQELGIITHICAYKVIHKEDLDEFKRFANASLSGIESKCKVRIITPRKEYVWYEIHAMIIRDENDEVSEIFGKMKNINKEQSLKDEHSKLNKYLSAMQELSEDILYKVDVETMTLYHMIESEQASLIGNEIPDYVDTFVRKKIVHPDDADRYVEHITAWYEDKVEDITLRFAINTKEYQWYTVKGKKIFDDKGNVVEVFGKLVNVHEKMELEYCASHDIMTNVLNKASFEKKISNILENATKEDNHALFFVDLDDFKYVNDKYGHAFGDVLLAEIGERFRLNIRDGDIIGRVGGDEFVIFIKNISSDEALIARAEKILLDINKEISSKKLKHKIKASLGIAKYPFHGKNYAELYNNADIALYNSKSKGKNIATIFNFNK